MWHFSAISLGRVVSGKEHFMVLSNLDARHSKESAWVSCRLKPRNHNFDNIMVTFKPINDAQNHLAPKVRIFARLNQDGNQIEICVANEGSQANLSMEVFLWNIRLDETQTIGSKLFQLPPASTKILSTFQPTDIRDNCGSNEAGYDFRIHFKPHF